MAAEICGAFFDRVNGRPLRHSLRPKRQPIHVRSRNRACVPFQTICGPTRLLLRGRGATWGATWEQYWIRRLGFLSVIFFFGKSSSSDIVLPQTATIYIICHARTKILYRYDTLVRVRFDDIVVVYVRARCINVGSFTASYIIRLLPAHGFRLCRENRTHNPVSRFKCAASLIVARDWKCTCIYDPRRNRKTFSQTLCYDSWIKIRFKVASTGRSK